MVRLRVKADDRAAFEKLVIFKSYLSHLWLKGNFCAVLR